MRMLTGHALLGKDRRLCSGNVDYTREDRIAYIATVVPPVD